jgi:F0F1-type ATP synthase assembly protein I
MPLIPLLLGLAPTVASWLMGDKTGAAVSQVTGIAREILGTSDAAGIERAIATDPNLALQFKMAVIQAEVDAKRAADQAEQDRRVAELEDIKARIADVQSARSQTVELAKAGSAIAWGSPIVSVLAIVVFAGFVYMLFAKVVPEGMKEALLLLGGSAATGYGMVLSYWLGSSSGSAQKTAALEKVASGR